MPAGETPPKEYRMICHSIIPKAAGICGGGDTTNRSTQDFLTVGKGRCVTWPAADVCTVMEGVPMTNQSWYSREMKIQFSCVIFLKCNVHIHVTSINVSRFQFTLLHVLAYVRIQNHTYTCKYYMYLLQCVSAYMYMCICMAVVDVYFK